MDSAGSTWRLGRRPALDGLRGVAVLMVMACHLGGEAKENGNQDGMHALGAAGVSMFFALSGFLITSLLLEEHAARGTISLRRFYSRRARRLFPALAVMMAGVVLLVHVGLIRPPTPKLLPSALYYANWYQIGGDRLGVLSPTWSLSIEEQFYLAWPLFLIVALHRRWNPVPILAVAIAASTALRFIAGGDRAYYGTDTQASTLLVGALLAVLAHRGLRELRLLPTLTLLLAMSPWVWALAWSRTAGDLWVPTIVPVLACVVAWALCCASGGLLASASLRYVGRRSYALYLWHLPMLKVARMEGWPLIVGIVAAFVLAEMSWWLVERPSLRRRPRVVGLRVRSRPEVLAAEPRGGEV